MITFLYFAISFSNFDFHGIFDNDQSKELLTKWKPPVFTEIDVHVYGHRLEKFIQARILLENINTFSIISQGKNNNMFICSKLKNIHRIDCCIWDVNCLEKQQKYTHFHNLRTWHEDIFPHCALLIGNVDKSSAEAWVRK